jgi:hypothetical protein
MRNSLEMRLFRRNILWPQRVLRNIYRKQFGYQMVIRRFKYDCVAYRDSFPDTIMTRVKSVPLLPCWTWAVFLILCFGVERLFV